MTNILFLGDKASLAELQLSPMIEAMLKAHSISVYDPTAPLEKQVADAEIMIVDGTVPITKEVVDAAKNLKFIQRFGIGMDTIDVGYILHKNVLLANSPGQLTGKDLAEHAILLMLALARRIGEWNETVQKRELWSPRGNGLSGKTLGIVGVGASGSELAKIAKAFGMRVIGIDAKEISKSDQSKIGLNFFGGIDSLDYVLQQSDYVSIHVPLTERTREMIGEREIALMKPTARLINVARGEIVDDKALVNALRSGQIAGAGFDVFPAEPIDPHHPILRMTNFVLSPHIAGTTWESIQERGNIVADNVDRVTRGLPPLHSITVPLK